MLGLLEECGMLCSKDDGELVGLCWMPVLRGSQSLLGALRLCYCCHVPSVINSAVLEAWSEFFPPVTSHNVVC